MFTHVYQHVHINGEWWHNIMNKWQLGLSKELGLQQCTVQFDNEYMSGKLIIIYEASIQSYYAGLMPHLINVHSVGVVVNDAWW